ncbi:MAG TPA: OmpW family outer membrane protein [Pseudomonadales bacterium]|nr:OmpW family outer membrane protein [Pseudomonadales bacterium]
MSKLKFALLAGAAATGFALSANALAYQAGDVVVRFGAATVEPKEQSEQVLPHSILNADNRVGLNSNTTAGISGTYFLDKNLAIEVLGALPFKHDIVGAGALQGLDVGSTKHLPPTVSLQFYPKVSESFHPYFGIGLNYTVFFGEDTTDELNAALTTVLSTPITKTDLKLDNSMGLAFQVGCDYQIDKNWAINAAVWKIDIDTTAHVRVNGGDSDATKFDVSIDPWAYMVGAAYKF